MEGVVRDVRLAIRLLFKQPGFSLVALLTLGLAIGGSTAIFSIIDAALLRPLPYPDPDRLVTISVDERGWKNNVSSGLTPSLDDVRDWQDHGDVLSHVAAWHTFPHTAVLDEGEPQRVDVRYMGDGFLAVHGVAPIIGRAISRDDMRNGAEPVVVLGYGFWRSRFGADRHIVGRTIRLDNNPAVIVGVTPPNFYREAHIWRPLPPSRRGSGGTVYGRMRAGVTVEQAQRELTDLTQRLDQERGRVPTLAVRVASLHERTAAGSRKTANILAAAVAFILLIACINVAGLLLARGAIRRPELAVRAAIGAGRMRLVRQLLTESLVLSSAAGALGLLLAYVTLDTIVSNIPMLLPSNSTPTLNPRVFGFAAALMSVVGIAFGLAPAIGLASVSATDALARASHRHGSALSRRGGQLLIASEVALAVVLLAGAGLMIRSFARLVAVDVGFDPGSVVTMEVVPVDPSQGTLRSYYPALVESLRGIPGVEAAGAVDYMPLASGSTMTSVFGEGEPFVAGPQKMVHVRQFLPGYFEAMRVQLKEGRLPTRLDTTRQVALLNERAAKQTFPAGSPLGRRFRFNPAASAPAFEVIGIVGEVRHWGPLSKPEPEVYVVAGHTDSGPMFAVVRPRGDVPALGQQLRKAAGAVGPRVVVQSIRRGSEWFDESVVTPRKRTVLLSLLGGLGLLLALVGVFGMTAYAVARRTQEIGVRMAFGARATDVVRLMVGDSIRPVVAGILIGLGAAALTMRVIASFLFDTPATDPATFAAVAATLAAAAFLAAWIPARRAAQVDPVTALRAE